MTEAIFIKRKSRWPRRGIYLLLFLFGLYVLFGIAFFWPHEGSVDHLEELLPSSVSYFVHCTFGDLRKSPVFRKHVLESPLRPRAEESLGLAEYLYPVIRDLEQRINESVPGILGKFSLLDDLAGREVVIAGNFTGAGGTVGDRVKNSPFVVLTRISFKARFMSVLKYGFVRERIPGLTAHRDFYEYELPEGAYEPGAPENARYRFFARFKDVLAVSNDRKLMEAVVHFGTARGHSEEKLPRDYYFYWDVRRPPADPGVHAWFRIREIDQELGNAFEEPGEERSGRLQDFVRALFPVFYTRTLTLNVGVQGEDTLPITGSIRLRKEFPRPLACIDDFHHVRCESLRGPVEKLAAEIPADGTFAAGWLRMSVRNFVLTSYMAAGPTVLAALFGPGGGAEGSSWDRDRAASQLGDFFEEGVGIAMARLPEVDEFDLDDYDTEDPLPKAAVTLFLGIKPQLEPRDLTLFFERNHGEYGLPEPKKIETKAGTIYSFGRAGDHSLALIEPAFAVSGHRFVWSTNAGELRRVLAALAGRGRTLADAPAFRAALAQAHEKGNLFLFVSGEKLRPWLLDQRWEYAWDASAFDREEYRKEEFLRISEQHPDWDRKRVAKERDRRMQRRLRRQREEDFPAALRRYRSLLFWAEPLDWAVLSTNVDGNDPGQFLALKGAIRLRPVKEEDGEPTR